MALGLNTEMSEGGDFLPIIMYMAKEGRLYKRDRVGGASGFDNLDTELPTGTKMVFDFGSIQVGYMHFAAGQAPSFALVPLGKTIPASPSKDHRQGFRMMVHLGQGGGKREFATTAKTVLGAVDDLHGEFEKAPEARAGKVPVVEFAGTERITTKNVHGTQTNFRPVFRIVQWIDRPADLGERTVPPPGGQAQAENAAWTAHAKANGGAASANPRHVGPPPAQAAGGWDAGNVAPPPPSQDDLNDTIPF